MQVCSIHHRWTQLDYADGSTKRRDCPECPRRRGARIINQFTLEPTGRRVAVPLEQ